ncbi:dTDP-4-dehydrorhamnose 3,5-epimerase [Ostreibacterium oceani]|uniref:dTDP-4-dehydrorhamnose 3,5-epimerase n=1 Tax=Ostreibacterium oceani TaxID=2654998 RepID=A0A6N7ESA5_9GAMM|nr:dTDP-4-dehydrorhamnose 3,5-epimerase [Ostreibacterium oceani]
MQVTETALPGVLIIEPPVFGDSRGFFLETFRLDAYQAIGLPAFVQSNHSRSRQGVLRGLHYQLTQPQGKLVRVSRGKVLDVAVDIRIGSPTFGRWASCILDDVSHRQFYVPANFAHGFLVLSETADFEYNCTDYYHPQSEQSLLWNDPEIGIDWGEISNLTLSLSDKDRQASRLSEKPKAQLPHY